MEARERMAADRRSKDEVNQNNFSLLNRLHLESKKRSKKVIMRRYIKDMQESISDILHSAGVGRLILNLLSNEIKGLSLRKNSESNQQLQ